MQNKLLFLTLFTLLISTCKNDRDTPSMDTNTTLKWLKGSSFKIEMSYDMTTHTYAQAVNEEDQDDLTLGEQTALAPIGVGCHVEVGISEDGALSAEIRMTQPDNITDLPAYTIGVTKHPEKFRMERMVINNGSITTYNADGDVLATSDVDISSVTLYSGIIDRLAEMESIRPLNNEEKTLMIDGMKEANLDIEATNNPRFELMTHTYSDGSSSKLVLDKELLVTSGQINYNASGKIENKSLFSFSGEVGAPVLEKHLFVTYLDGPLSGKPMAIVKHSVFDNFILNIQ